MELVPEASQTLLYLYGVAPTDILQTTFQRAGMAHRIVQFTDGHFSKERSLLPLVYSWAMIEDCRLIGNRHQGENK